MSTRPMPIRLRMLYEKINVFVPFSTIQMVGEIDLDQEIESINLLTNNGTIYGSYVYVCKYSKDLIISPGHCSSKLIIIADKHEKTEKIKEIKNYLIIYSELDFEKVYNALLNAVILAKNTNLNFYEKYTEKNISELIVLGERLLTNPYMLLNKHFKLEGYSTNRKSNEEIYNSTIELGEIGYKYLSLIFEGDIFKTLCSNGEILLPENNNLSKNPLYIKQLRKEEKIVGYGFLICENNIPMKDMLSYNSTFICNFTFLLLENENKNSSFKDLQGLLLIKLLDEESNREYLLLKAKEININIKEKFFCLQVNHKDRETMLEDFLIMEISKYCPKFISFEYNGNFQLLLYLNSYNDLESVSRELGNLINKYKIEVGISELTEELGKIKLAYMQSTAALAHGLQFADIDKRELFYKYPSTVFKYCDFSKIDMLHLYYQHYGFLPEDFRKLTEMINIDKQKNNKEYMHSDTNILFVYLRNQLRIQETANELFMHRNSVVYRLNIITEKLGVFLEDEKTRDKLMLTYLINDYKKAHLK